MATTKKKTTATKTAKPAPKKAAAPSKKSPQKKTAVPVAPKKETKASAKKVSSEERLQMIQTAAYFKAEKRGFSGGNSDQDWADAEREVDALLAK